ncbi:hypothetical protein [Streptomyces pathocidini]|uniref:hypothetical protein n=1 Tax=Streptomyces pathocidini TaxID=1650571 RepID=UPI0030B82540
MPHGQPAHGQPAYGPPADDPYGAVAQPPHASAPEAPGPAWQQPHSATTGRPYESPQTQIWQGPTHQDTYAAMQPTAAQPTAAHPADSARSTADSAPAAPAAPSAPLTPAQQARAEGRSPIIPPGMRPALLTAGLAALIAGTATLARPALAVAVVLLQALTAAGWYRLNGMWPARQGIALAFAGGLVTDVALLATGREDATTVALGTLGVWCLLVLILQLRSHSSPDERLYALTAGVASTAFAVLASGHLAAAAVSSGAVVVGAVAVAVAVVTRALRLPPYVSPVVAVLAAAGAGVSAGGATGIGAAGALIGLVAGGCALIGLRVASYDYPSRFVHMTAGVALPLAMAAPAVYVLARVAG